MKHYTQLIFAMILAMIMALASCQISGVSPGSDDTVSANGMSDEQYGTITVNVPPTGRGWDIAKYIVSATRGTVTETKETTGKSVTMRLKIGQWAFSAKAVDANGTTIYQSPAKTGTVAESNNSPVSLLLSQQSSAVKYSFDTSDSLFKGTDYSIDKIVIQLESKTNGFDQLTAETTGLGQTVTVTKLLSSSDYTATVKGYIGETVYLSGSFTQTAIKDTINIVNAGTKQLSQCKVTPISASAASGSSFSSSSVKLTLTSATDGADIYYTLDGTTPTSSSSEYNQTGISIFSGANDGAVVTVKAIAIKSGLESSDVFSASYTYNESKASSPSFSLPGGTYSEDKTLSITNNESSGTLQYKINDGSWQTYSSSISLNENGKTYIVYAKVTGVTDKTDSDEINQTYIIKYPQLGAVTISPEAGTYTETQLFTLTAPVSGAVIYYTTDGTTPTSASTKYTEPFTLSKSDDAQTIKAYCVKSGWTDSNVETQEGYIINAAEVDDGITFTLAKSLRHDNDAWTNDADDGDLPVGATVFKAGGFTASKSYEFSWSPTDMQVSVSVYLNDKDNQITDITRNGNTVTFSAGTGITSDDLYYFIMNVTEAVSNAQLTIVESGTTVPVTALTISPDTGLTISVEENKTFSVVYTPSNATTGKDVTWEVGDASILALSGTTVTGLKAGTTYLKVTSAADAGISASVYITVVGSTTTTTTTTTTIAPINNGLGYTYPASGPLSPADQSTWGSSAYTLGANVSDGNTTFALYSANATKVLLEIYDAAYGADAVCDYWMTKHSSSSQWQAKLTGDLTGKIYAFRLWGPNWTYSESWTRGDSSAGYVSDCDSSGNRFNPNKVVFDPYAREITHDPSNASAVSYSAQGYAAMSSGETYRNYDSGKISPKGYVITDSTDYGTKPQIAQKDAIIYEAHVRGLTKHESSSSLTGILSKYDGFTGVYDIPASYRGTYKGAALMAGYLKGLGINTIELLPVHETDNDANPDDGPGGNFWGYMTFDYFAPDRRYSYDKTAGGPTKEFKEMVKAFHDAGIEVYLDVVYNHSGEGGPWNGAKDENAQCTVVSMRGIDNATYYSLVASDKSAYWETTGCGNNLQCDNTYVRQFILDSLTYWIDEMGVDGFRFDLATVLGREYNSSTTNWDYHMNAQTLTDIAALGQTKNVEMIAESWDCGDNSYQVGYFPDGWAGWNGYTRDTVRGFIGSANPNAKIKYSDAIYGDINHFSVNDPSVNFICAHDGFTLADLCSYSGAGNAANGVLEWPFGPSDGGNSDNNSITTHIIVTDPDDWYAYRRQRARNYFTMQMFSAGIPMIVYGDEFGRTQNGNNNPYNIDSVATWNNYYMVDSDTPQGVSTGDTGSYNNMFGTFANTEDKNGLFDFARYVMNERASNESLRQLTGKAAGITYYKNNYTESGFSGDSDLCLGLGINLSHSVSGAAYYVMFNMCSEEKPFTFPAPSSGYEWTRIIDTGSWAENVSNYWADTDTVCRYDSSDSYGVGAYRIVVLKEVKQTPTCSAPTITGSLGTSFSGGTNTITLATNTDEATIYYTTDGSEPSASNGTAYTAVFTITKTTTIKAVTVKNGYKNSEVITKTFTNTAVMTDPVLSVPAGNFWNTITVFVSTIDSNAALYYTTNDTEPTTSSTAYTAAGIDITATTTLKVLSHDTSGVKTDAIVSAVYTLQSNPSYTEDASGVMLQGFNWDSANLDDRYWYSTVTDNASAIKDTFEYIWLPPPSKAASFAKQGYGPTELNDLNNYYGTAAELTALISSVSPTKAIADIVVNHRAGYSGWGDFENPRWCDDYLAICMGDDGFTASGSDMLGWTGPRGAADTGTDYDSFRDLDHTSTYVQKGIYSWMNSVLKRVGFAGWRYDFVHGFSGDYVGYYNAKSSAAFSVGELWSPNSRSEWPSIISNWISATGNTVNGTSGQSSRAFDFVLKGFMSDVFGCNESGVANSSYGTLASNSSLMISNPSAAVTFVDNHDTGSTQCEWYLDPNDVGTAYVLILTHPGYPCVAWQHYFTYAQSGSKGTDGGAQYMAANSVNGSKMGYTLREHIDYLISLRKSHGIKYNSTRTTLDATDAHYAALIEGDNGNLIVEIGSGYDPGDYLSSYSCIYYGDGFAVYSNKVCASPSITFDRSAGTCTITCSTDGAAIKYSTDGENYYTYSSAFSVSDGTTVYAYASKSGLEDSAKVSNQYIAATMLATTYETSWGQNIYFGYRIYNSSGTEIKEWTTVVGTYTKAGSGYNWYAMIPSVTGGATISWKAYMVEENGGQSWMSDPDRSTPVGVDSIQAW